MRYNSKNLGYLQCFKIEKNILKIEKITQKTHKKRFFKLKRFYVYIYNTFIF